ncbi:MAG: helix-turn-helix domain-containing protein [Clostridia bacterium]|nr:helix-turn-helix domain-containing protein [Clostridia bacterium]
MAFAALLPAQLEGDSPQRNALTRSQFFQKILQGEGTPSLIYQYERKYAPSTWAFFVVVIETEKLAEEVATLSAEYGENGLDVALPTEDGRVVLVRFSDKKEEVSAQKYAEFLAQFIKEELGVDVRCGVGPVVQSVGEVLLSYQQALSALHYSATLKDKETVCSYKDYVLIKMMEELPEGRLQSYFSLLALGSVKEIFDDEEMVETAKEFLRNNLNVSEAARSMYLHRNTLTYRLDKIERATGLNIRIFSHAATFHLLSLLYPLIND